MADSVYVRLEVHGLDRNVQSFLQLCKRIEELGVIGSSDDIQVWVDGDGAGQLKFNFLDNDLDFKKVTPAAFVKDRDKYIVNIE